MNDAMRVELDGRQAVYRPGERLRGRGVWRLQQAPEKLELRLFWFTEGAGDRDLDVIETVSLDAGVASGEEPFEFEVPSAPLSFTGQLVTLIWAVELVANPGSLAARREFVVGHGSGEIDITADLSEER